MTMTSAESMMTVDSMVLRGVVARGGASGGVPLADSRVGPVPAEAVGVESWSRSVRRLRKGPQRGEEIRRAVPAARSGAALLVLRNWGSPGHHANDLMGVLLGYDVYQDAIDQWDPNL
jgi:hypothetical protein